MSSITNARTDNWHCGSCGGTADLAALSAEVGLVRLAAHGEDGFRLGTVGVEDRVAALLAPCGCGGAFEPGTAPGEAPVTAQFRAEALAPVAETGWQVLMRSTDPRLSDLAAIWRPRALRAAGRVQELSKQELLELKVESKLQQLMYEMRQARAAGDEDAEDAAHARYVELGTIYVQRFVRGPQPATGAG
jgi:hypothetical protein